MIQAWLLPLFTSLLPLATAPAEADLVFVGDAMQHQAQLDAAKACGGGAYDYSACFEAIEPLVSAADYAVVNLETPVGEPPYSGYPCFNAPVAFVDALAHAGFDLFLTANNHTLDHRPSGLRATAAYLDSRGLDHIGTYASDSVRAASLPFIRQVCGFRIGFLNYTYGTNGISPRDGVVVDYIDRPLIKADVEAARAAGAEILCVCIHWGDEYRLVNNRTQAHLADFLEALGVDLIIGAHPHVVQPMELRPNRYRPDRQVLVVYSLGNFISNMRTADTRGGALVHARLRRDSDGVARLAEADCRLLFTTPPVSRSDNFRVVEADSVRGTWQSHARNFAGRTRATFARHNKGIQEACCAEP